MLKHIFVFVNFYWRDVLKVIMVFALCFWIGMDSQLQAQGVAKWEGPWKDSVGWDCWRATLEDGSTMWVWDNAQGERKFAFDKNNDGRYESWQEVFAVPNQPVLVIHHWDENQDNREEALAWCDGGTWIEKVWDSNNDGAFDSWCKYEVPGCVQGQCAGKGSFRLVEKKNTFDAAYREYVSAQSQSTLVQKRAYAQYKRADLIFRICKLIELR